MTKIKILLVITLIGLNLNFAFATTTPIILDMGITTQEIATTTPIIATTTSEIITIITLLEIQEKKIKNNFRRWYRFIFKKRK